MTKIISQTNRTMLFEEINPEKLDLLTIIGGDKDNESLDDAKLNEIHENLLVGDFKEFLEKFDPKVYSFFNANTQKIHYALEKPAGVPDDAVTEIPINMENAFFKMLCTLIDARKSQGNKNVDFKFESILDMISPKKVMDDIKQLRKEISYVHEKYEGLEDDDPSKLELGDKLNTAFEKASLNYNNVLGMLPLAIEDIKTRILIGANEGQDQTEDIKIGLLTMGDNGELKIVEKEKEEETDVKQLENSNSQNLALTFKEDYEYLNENDSNEYVGALVARTFVPLPANLEDIDYELEASNYNQYLDFYKSAQEDFVKIAKPLIEKILGVRTFFEQYNPQVKNMKPKLLIVNTKLEMLLKGDNKKAIIAFLNATNNKNDFENTIWFGIIPSVDSEDNGGVKKVRQRFRGNEKKTNQDTNSMASLTMLMDILKNYKVQAFFNIKPDEKSTFNSVAANGVDSFFDKTEALQGQKYSEFLIPCLPNFTIIPKEKSSVILDYKMKVEEDGVALSKEKEDLLKFWIEGVYIDAAYVGAGITAAYQCPDYLKGSFKKLNVMNPGVRLNLEAGDNSLKIKTSMSKEISGYTSSVKDQINRRNFGFVFSSDNAQLDGEDIKNITVYKARSLAANDDGKFEPIYKTLTTTYIERILRYTTNDFKEDKLIHFFSGNPKSQKTVWLKDQEKANSILQLGDDIRHEIEGDLCQLHISFNGDVKNLTVDVTKS